MRVLGYDADGKPRKHLFQPLHGDLFVEADASVLWPSLQ